MLASYISIGGLDTARNGDAPPARARLG